ncbi:MAG: branched-chain amino acid transporter permease protein, partial [candidate division NC10 bacterium]|nr:branched-chain amino acid transporter permease protein [candidate division NC10 bacterium]
MSLNVGFLIITVLKIAGLLAWVYGLLWGLGQRTWVAKLVTIVAAFAVIQLAISLPLGPVRIFSDFDSGLLFQACTMAMVALGLNLIYGFNGQFSLGQWGFYGIGAYAAADITYRWTNDDASGLLVAGIGVVLIGLVILGVHRFLNQYTGVPVMSAFTLYLFGSIAAGAVAVMIGGAGHAALAPLFGTKAAPGPLQSPAVIQVVFFLAVLLAGAVAAEISFLFGLPVLSLGSDY